MNWKELKETIGFKLFKNDYIKIFEAHHPQLLKKVDDYRQPRIYKNDKHEEESILNYINTNVLAYSILVNKTLGKIDFDPTTKEGYETMMDYVINNEWFWKGILPDINDKILYTTSKGNKKEELVRTKLSNYFNTKDNYEIEMIGKLGDLTDMRKGIDMVIKGGDGKEYKCQIKSCISITLNDDFYDIKYTGVNKLYDGNHYMIFVIGEDIHVFDNKKIMIDKDGYKCHKEGLRITL